MTVPTLVRASALGNDAQPAASERISLGIIGVNGMGRANLENCARHPDVEVTAICDVWQERLDAAVVIKENTPYSVLSAICDIAVVSVDHISCRGENLWLIHGHIETFYFKETRVVRVKSEGDCSGNSCSDCKAPH